jgi:hypothetical protein
MLLKFALILGVDFMENITFDGICPKNLLSGLNGASATAGHVSQSANEEDGKRKTRFTGSLTTNKEEEEENSLLSSSDDQLDGNVCGRVRRSDPAADNSSMSATRSTSSSSTSSSRCNGKNGCGSSHRELSGTESENHNLPVHNRHPCAVIHEQHVVASDHRKGSASQVTAPEAGGCDSHQQQQQSCTCCCHLHRDGQSYWNSDPDAYQYQTGAFAHFSVTSMHPATASAYTDYDSMLKRLHGFQFDVILGADGRRNTLSDHFPRKEFRGRLAIAITANFVNTHTLTEAQIPEISGISFIYNQQLFRYVTSGICSTMIQSLSQEEVAA